MQVFLEVYSDRFGSAQTSVFWGLKSSFCEQGPYTFQLQWAPGEGADFIDVGTPVVDAFSVTDVIKRDFAKSIESVYRVILTLPTGQTFTSFHQQASGSWTKRDWLIGREICRREFILNSKYTGWNGKLLKRKVSGPPCPKCVDWDTKVAKGDCLVCFGTGIEGGYWAAIADVGYPMTGYKRHKVHTEKVAVIEDTTRVLRMPSCPHRATYDVFVNLDTNERYYVHPVKPAALIKGIALVDLVEMKLAPNTDIIYKVPLEPSDEVYVVEPPVVEVICTERTDVLPLPEAPTVVIPAEEEPLIEEMVAEDEPTPIIETGIFFGIWFSNGEWYYGQDIGDDDNALFVTEGAIQNHFILPTFTWVVKTAVLGSTISLSFSESPIKIDVVTSVAGASGSLIISGTYNGAQAYMTEI